MSTKIARTTDGLREHLSQQLEKLADGKIGLNVEFSLQILSIAHKTVRLFYSRASKR